MSMGLDRKPQVRRTTPPSESVVVSWYENASLLDSYSIDLSASEAQHRFLAPKAASVARVVIRPGNDDRR